MKLRLPHLILAVFLTGCGTDSHIATRRYCEAVTAGTKFTYSRTVYVSGQSMVSAWVYLDQTPIGDDRAYGTIFGDGNPEGIITASHSGKVYTFTGPTQPTITSTAFSYTYAANECEDFPPTIR